ncbi:MAG: CoA activase [Candidatus Eisenbacteria bacterium]|nr:CoA activase [Candidatus Eisenbacteria bacterium]
MLAESADRVRIGCDVGSTAIKVVAVDAAGRIAWKAYRRHGTRQGAALVELLRELDLAMPGALARGRLFFTGNGGRLLAEAAQAPFFQEVNAVAEATERLHPGTASVVDLGGQDAKILLWQTDPRTGRRRKIFSMNDKCAGGTGSVIDRIAAKLGFSSEELQRLPAGRLSQHRVAARCGVFAETDVNSLQKQGVPAEELIRALFEAIVQQNLSVLARGATLRPPVLLLGGPNAFLPGLVDAWRRGLGSIWAERGISERAGEETVRVPADACYFAALGSIFSWVPDGRSQGHAKESHSARDSRGTGESRPAPLAADQALRMLEAHLERRSQEAGLPPLLASEEAEQELRAVARQASPLGFPRSGGGCDAVLGLDAGSTSTKAVLLSPSGELLASSYRLSCGDPFRDAQAVLGDLRDQATRQGATVKVRSLGVTGYAKDLLGALLGADLVLVETVAHARSALAFCPQAEVIVDVGGQDIKVLTLRNGRVRDFRLNSQCSAGNGYFLQSTSARFGIPLTEFAAHAFRARRAPEFHFGCAVFLEADIVNFQQLGWQPEEILAGLARVLPKNVWLYVVGEPNLARLGRIFILQGGTQRNLAAVKAELDFIRGRVRDADVRVHPHTGEAGAIGVALEILRRGIHRLPTRFPGWNAISGMEVRECSELAGPCPGCANKCERTLVEARLPGGERRRFVAAPCEVGRALAEASLRKREEMAEGEESCGPASDAAASVGEAGQPDRPARHARASRPAPDFAAEGARIVFAPDLADAVLPARTPAADAPSRAAGPSPLAGPARMAGPLPFADPLPAARRSRRGRPARAQRAAVRIGLPRTLNLYQVAPYFIGYFRALGLTPEQIVVSGPTTERLFRAGARRGAIDTCFPSKVALAQVHDLVEPPRADWIFFPILINLPAQIHPVVDAWVCPTSQATPEVVKAAFQREGDLFAQRGMTYLDPVFNMGEPLLFERQMLAYWGPRLGVTGEENRAAMTVGGQVLSEAYARLRASAAKEIRLLERERRAGIVALGRPYHDDPGLNHGILRDLNRRGYPIFTIASLPRDPDFLERLFGEEIARGWIEGPFDISDVWKNSFSANSNQKLWAAKVVARHPNLVGLDLSSFRCGHDAPILATVESILEAAGTPYFTFHDIDENRPSGAIRLRVETIDYSLREYERLRLAGDAPEAAPQEAIRGASEDEVLV